MIKVLVLDEDKATRMGIRQFFSHSSIEIVGDASTWSDGLKIIQEKNPDIVLLELHLPDAIGSYIVDYLERHHPHIHPIYLTKNRHIPTLHKFITESSIKGILTKELNFSGIEALKTVFTGGRFIDPVLSYELINHKDDYWSSLSKRECEIILQVLEGRTTTEIADNCRLSQKTVMNIKANAFKKLRIKSKEQLVDVFKLQSIPKAFEF